MSLTQPAAHLDDPHGERGAGTASSSAVSNVAVLDAAHTLATATYERVGDNLGATWRDGTELIVRGYFAAPEPADLVTVHGERLTSGLVARLAGPQSPGQYAQAGSLEPEAAVGRVTTVSGAATATRPDGTTVELAVDTPIGQGDVLATGPGSALAVVFADGTSFSLGADARMVVDEFVYDPSGGASTAGFGVLQGVFVFVSGEVAHQNPDAMTLTTPVATIGIRGTTLALRIAAVGLASLIGLLQDADGALGSVTVTTQVASIVLDQPNQATVVTSLFAAPGNPFVLSPQQIADVFGAVLAALGLALPDQDVEQDQGSAESDGGSDGAADGTDVALDGEIEQGYVVVLPGGVTSVVLPPSEPITLTAEQVASLGVLGVGETDSGQKFVVFTGFGDDDDVIVLAVDTENVGVGTAGDDVFVGSGDSDAFFADDGNDSVAGAGGNDSLFGGPGDDRLEGGDDDDLLVGEAGNDVIFGDNGNDTLLGDALINIGGLVTGNDSLNGGAGDDDLQPGPGTDSYDGGPGRDRLDLSDGVQSADVDLGIGEAFNDGHGNAELFAGIEDVFGTQFGDHIVGGAGDNVLDGFQGDDVLEGFTGDDVLFGDEGFDFLGGGGGVDTLTGGTDGDVFKFFDPSDGGAVGANVPRGAISGDFVSDFVSGEDSFQFALGAFDPSRSAGPVVLGDNFSVIGAVYDGTNPGTNIAFGDGTPTFVFSAADHTLHYDPDGIGAGYTVIATLTNNAVPTAADIELV